MDFALLRVRCSLVLGKSESTASKLITTGAYLVHLVLELGLEAAPTVVTQRLSMLVGNAHYAGGVSKGARTC